VCSVATNPSTAVEVGTSVDSGLLQARISDAIFYNWQVRRHDGGGAGTSRNAV
jgi:hypothetical protein